MAAGIGLFNAPANLASRSPNAKLGTAIIGAGGRGMAHLGIAMSEQLVALVDTDDSRMQGALGVVDKTPGYLTSRQPVTTTRLTETCCPRVRSQTCGLPVIGRSHR
jgi:hypothetical protein